MVESISSDLLNFKKSVDGKLDSMTSNINDIKNKISELMAANSNASSSISQVYNSNNKIALLGKFTNIEEVYKTLSNSIQDTIEPIMVKCSTLLDKIKDLEIKKSTVESAYSSNNSNYYNLLNEYNRMHNEAKTLFDELKGNDSNVSFMEKFQTNDISTISENLKFGSYEKYCFTSSSNYKINYYLYTPDYGEKVSGLPTLVYIPGAGERGDRTNTSGLPLLIDQRKITPSGMVLIPQYSGEEELKTSEYENALFELINYAVAQNDGDKNKISLCGHSLGATIGYKLIADNPDLFSAFVPISGKTYNIVDKEYNINNNAYNVFKNMSVLSICGDGDHAYGNYQSSKKFVEDMKNVNSNVHFVPLYGFGHIIQTKVFGESYQLENGQTVSILDWAFNQKKNS